MARELMDRDGARARASTAAHGADRGAAETQGARDVSAGAGRTVREGDVGAREQASAAQDAQIKAEQQVDAAAGKSSELEKRRQAAGERETVMAAGVDALMQEKWQAEHAQEEDAAVLRGETHAGQEEATKGDARLERIQDHALVERQGTSTAAVVVSLKHNYDIQDL
ncbi:hypothetical protein PF005_g3122 [Phytophthora fragariae]|uniref:Uncharacterized protein n=1 Tax=Phytophthora fragariae TaxID=53985 RepID=A0A6A3ZAZ9_9STRA|nr:hypothetical protein PF009_g17563 [Phytophthora fragariae]KAE9105217.1 hypothetical protein PF006_g21702 [Phytophthora fragariae]KAE9128654.1 hypothetical protein PF007_g5187 [Phytophthora fragariae]KAE9231335.1 hypothetical protein PF005_g3122 [Phytophthora fragariae]